MGRARISKVEKEVLEKVDRIRRKVAGNQGKIALCMRKIVTGEHEGAIHYEDYIYLFEAGVVSGELIDKREETKTSGHLDLGVKLPVLREDPHISNLYYFSHDYAIPVRRKFVTSGIGINLFGFSPEDLKKFNKGEIDFSFLEVFGGLPCFPGYRKEVPYLSRFDLAVGDKEVTKVIEAENLASRDKIRDFFRLLKEPGELEKRVAEYDFGQRQNLARTLIQEVAGLCTFHDKILAMKAEVLTAKAGIDTDDEGRYPHVVWGDYEQIVDNYHNLEKQARVKATSIREIIEKAKEFDLTKLPGINGRASGFPAVVSTADYLAHVQGIVLPGAEGTIKVIDNHLEQERKRVEAQIKGEYSS